MYIHGICYGLFAYIRFCRPRQRVPRARLWQKRAGTKRKFATLLKKILRRRAHKKLYTFLPSASVKEVAPNLPVARIVQANRCVPFWRASPLTVRPAGPYRHQHFAEALAAFGPADVVWRRQHPPNQPDLADSAAHWNPPKRVRSLDRPCFGSLNSLNKFFRMHLRNYIDLSRHNNIFFSKIFFFKITFFVFFSNYY